MGAALRLAESLAGARDCRLRSTNLAPPVPIRDGCGARFCASSMAGNRRGHSIWPASWCRLLARFLQSTPSYPCRFTFAGAGAVVITNLSFWLAISVITSATH